MNEARKRQAEDFARHVMREQAEGLAALLEGLEWAAFQRWKQAPGPEAWRAIAGELAAYRQMGAQIRTVGLTEGADDGTSGKQ